MRSGLGNPELARIIFARRNVQPPTTLYVSRDDYLTITTVQSDLPQDPAFVLVRILTPLGVVQHMTYRNGAATASSGFQKNRFPLREGQLLGVEVRAGAGGVFRGHLWAAIELTHSLGPVDQEHAVLAADYVTQFQPIGWPQGSVRSPEEGPGHDRLFTLVAPAAGFDIEAVVPSLCRWQLKSIEATLTTSAVGAERRVSVVVDDSIQVQPVCYAGTSIGSSTTRVYAFTQAQLRFALASTQIYHQEVLPPGMWIRKNWKVKLFLALRQAGDAWSSSNWWVEEALSA